MIEKVSPPLLLITTSSVFAILRTSARRCLASEYVYTSNIFYSIIVMPISCATLCMPRSKVSSGARRLTAHSKKYASYAYMLNLIAIFNADFMSVFLKSTVMFYKSKANCIASRTRSSLSSDSVAISDPIFPLDTVCMWSRFIAQSFVIPSGSSVGSSKPLRGRKKAAFKSLPKFKLLVSCKTPHSLPYLSKLDPHPI